MQVEDFKRSFLTEEMVMEVTGYSKKTIQTYRSEGSDKIPPMMKIGSKWVCPVKEFEKWVAHQPVLKPVA